MSKPKKKKKQFESIYEEDDLTTPGIEIHTNPKIPKLKPLQTNNDRRGAPRYDLNFEAVIFCRGNSFRTKTINISNTGALLADNVPIDFVDQELEIVLTRTTGRNKETFLFKGKSLGAPFRSPRIHFTKMEDTQLKKLDNLFRISKRYHGDEA